MACYQEPKLDLCNTQISEGGTHLCGKRQGAVCPYYWLTALFLVTLLLLSQAQAGPSRTLAHTRRAHEALQAMERHSGVGEYSWAVPLGDRSAWPGAGAAHGFSTAMSSPLACSQQTEPVNHKLQMFFPCGAWI